MTQVIKLARNHFAILKQTYRTDKWVRELFVHREWRTYSLSYRYRDLYRIAVLCSRCRFPSDIVHSTIWV
jgi:hypothetical protein